MIKYILRCLIPVETLTTLSPIFYSLVLARGEFQPPPNKCDTLHGQCEIYLHFIHFVVFKAILFISQINVPNLSCFVGKNLPYWFLFSPFCLFNGSLKLSNLRLVINQGFICRWIWPSMFYLITQLSSSCKFNRTTFIREKWITLQSVLPEDLFLKLKMTECWFEKKTKKNTRVQNVHCTELGI